MARLDLQPLSLVKNLEIGIITIEKYYRINKSAGGVDQLW